MSKNVINRDWRHMALAATIGTKFGAIIACALGDARESTPRFEGKAIITSDGFVQCDFIDSFDEFHHMAFVGAYADLELNMLGLIKHLSLNAPDSQGLRAALRGWIATDFRSGNRS